MTDDEKRRLIEQTARQTATHTSQETIHRLFMQFGVNINEDSQLQELQKDFSHVRAWRKQMELITATVTSTVTKTIVVAVLGATLVGLTTDLKPTHVIQEVVEEPVEFMQEAISD